MPTPQILGWSHCLPWRSTRKRGLYNLTIKKRKLILSPIPLWSTMTNVSWSFRIRLILKTQWKMFRSDDEGRLPRKKISFNDCFLLLKLSHLEKMTTMTTLKTMTLERKKCRKVLVEKEKIMDFSVAFKGQDGRLVYFPWFSLFQEILCKCRRGERRDQDYVHGHEVSRSLLVVGQDDLRHDQVDWRH